MLLQITDITNVWLPFYHKYWIFENMFCEFALVLHWTIKTCKLRVHQKSEEISKVTTVHPEGEHECVHQVSWQLVQYVLS